MQNSKFCAEVESDGCISWIRDYMKESGSNKVVIGIRVGKVSYVAAALCCKAIGAENVTGVMMPNHDQSDIDDSFEVCKNLGIPYIVADIGETFDSVKRSLHEVSACGAQFNGVNEPSELNIAPRVRMIYLYGIAQTIGARVCGTGNLSETTVGYSTKYGDTAYDFNPLGSFTSIEVVQIGDYLGLMEEIVHKTPADGLSGVSDEEKLGISYQKIHNYLRNGEISIQEYRDIHAKYLYSRHKYDAPPEYEYYGWEYD